MTDLLRFSTVQSVYTLVDAKKELKACCGSRCDESSSCY